MLQGMTQLLKRQGVLYVLLEFWPAAMHRDAGVEAQQVLELLTDCGYTLFDTQTIRMDGGMEPTSTRSTFSRPTNLKGNAEWYLEMDRLHSSRFGYWTDIVAVASNAELARFK